MCDWRDHEKETRPVRKHLLVVVRNFTSLDRVLELLHALTEDLCLAIKFVVDAGSKFANGITERLRSLGMDVISWEQARQQPWDAIYAAHVDKRLAQLRGPLLVTAHGVSYNRIRSESTGGDTSYPAGLSPFELTAGGQVYPAFIGLGHPEQLSRIFPEGRAHAVLVGDLVMDKLVANRHQRRKIRDQLGVGDRQLICVSSTWGDHSTVGTQLSMVKRLVAELPSDEYVVALVAHPNVWIGGSPYELRMEFDDQLDSGLLLIDLTCWQAALVAADLLIGDHGSVSNYAAGLGLPVLIAADGDAELHPASPVSWLHARLPRVDHAAPLRRQVERVLAEHRRDRWREYTQEIFGLPGKGLEATANAVRALMNVPPLRRTPRPKAVRMPKVHEGNPLTSYRVVLRPGEVGHVERHPAHVTTPATVSESILVALAEEVCPTTRDNAEVLVHTERLPAEEAQTWLKEALIDCPSAALVAAATEDGGVALLFSDGMRLTAARGDPFVAAVAVYWWRLGRLPTTARTFVLTMGNKTHTVVLD